MIALEKESSFSGGGIARLRGGKCECGGGERVSSRELGERLGEIFSRCALIKGGCLKRGWSRREESLGGERTGWAMGVSEDRFTGYGGCPDSFSQNGPIV